ncbi:hypothetical protein ACJX0J_014761, partial [Zea mays]
YYKIIYMTKHQIRELIYWHNNINNLLAAQVHSYSQYALPAQVAGNNMKMKQQLMNWIMLATRMICQPVSYIFLSTTVSLSHVSLAQRIVTTFTV